MVAVGHTHDAIERQGDEAAFVVRSRGARAARAT
jgi:hypothetical protein